MAKQKKQHVSKTRKIIVTILGVFGYLSLLLQWLWVGALYLPSLLQSNLQGLLLPEQAPAHTESHAITFDGPDMLLLIIGVAVTVIVIIVTLVVIARIPIAIAKAGNKVSETVAEAALPIITHRHTLPPKKKRKLTAQLVVYVKFILALLPLAGLVGLWFISFELSDDIVIFISVFFTLGTVIWFTLQYLLAKLLRVPLEDII